MPNLSESDTLESETNSVDSEVAELLEQGITQKITRISQDNFDSIVGLFRCDLEPDQTRYILNIPIYPAMEQIPDVETVVFEEGIRTRTTNCEKFGVRLELVDSKPATVARSIFIETIISSSQGT